jgi:hypothetical protein
MNTTRLLVTGALAGAALFAASPALAAPTPRECASASEDALSLQKQEKLSAAKERLLVCADTACPAEIRDECGRRLTATNDAIPSVVFDVKDASGNDVSQVRVTMDGALLIDHLGASAITVDPGEHTFRFEGADPSQAVEKKLVVRDGEKNRHLAVVLGGAPGVALGLTTPPAGAQAPAPTPDQATPSTWSGQKTAALVVGAVGIVGVGVGAAFGAMAFGEWKNAKNECVDSCGAGSQAQGDKNNASTSATISDIGIIAGGVLVGAAAVVWFTAPSGAQVQVAPTAGPQGAGLTLRGTF